MISSREYLRNGNFKPVPKHESVDENGWFDMEDYIEHGNYFLLKRGRICRSRRKSWQ